MKNKTGIGPKVIVGILMVYLFLPFFITLVYSLTDMWNITVLPESYTLKFYVEMFTSERFWMAIGRSIFISTVSVALAVLVMTPVVFAIAAFSPRLESVMKIITLLPYAIPGVISAAALLRAPIPPLRPGPHRGSGQRAGRSAVRAPSGGPAWRSASSVPA